VVAGVGAEHVYRAYAQAAENVRAVSGVSGQPDRNCFPTM
jgi:hypothetical protein